jgi:GABA(A) receptor-associated protein
MMNWLSQPHTRKAPEHDGVFKIKEEKTFEERVTYSQSLRNKYSDRVPIIVEKNFKQTELQSLERNKYLVPSALSVGQFVLMIRKHIKLQASAGLFIFINNKLVPNSSTIGEVYAAEKEADGFLYVVYALENAFG